MAGTGERAYVNQGLQAGVETTPGTGVPANKQLTWQCDMGITPSLDPFAASGEKYYSDVKSGAEYTDIAVTFDPSYDEINYLFSGLLPAANITNPGTLARAWAYTPPIRGRSSGQKTYTFQQGDDVRAQSTNFVQFTGFSLKGDPKTVSGTATAVGRPITDDITLTSSPTQVACTVISPKDVTIYYDAAQGGLGGTAFDRLLEWQIDFNNAFQPEFNVRKSDASNGFVAVIDDFPTATIKVIHMANTLGMLVPLANMRLGTTGWLRWEAVGAQIDGVGPTNYKLTFDAAVKIIAVDKFSNKGKVYAIGWTFGIMKNAAWGKAWIVTATSQQTAL